MKAVKRLLALLLSLLTVLSLVSCSAPSDGEQQDQTDDSQQEQNQQEEEQYESYVAVDGKTLSSKHWKPVELHGETVYSDGMYVYEPDEPLDITTMSFADFGEGYFTETYPVTVDTYKLCEGLETETEVYHIKSENPGPVLYLVGGVHGDERAGWFTATLMRNVTISCGELYVLSCANQLGANKLSRTVKAGQDLNRSFPGKTEGNEADVLANAIITDIADKNPEFVFDLHEAIIMTEGRDCLDSVLIFTILDGMEDMYFDLLFATQDGDICHNAFEQSGPGPAGSLNATVGNQLGIPVITVETLRGFSIYRRVQDQLDIVQYVLDYKGML